MEATTASPITYKPADFKSSLKPIWCPGCGDFGVLSALYKAMSICGMTPETTAIVSGIGCSSRLPGFVNAYGFHGVHGRALPIAAGIKIARPDLNVIAVGGDGDGYSIGAGHLSHAARRNLDITYLVMNNNTYGLTKGQVSPTSLIPLASEGQQLDSKRWKTTPYGNTEDHNMPLALAIALDVSFVARGFSYQPTQLTEILVQAIKHRGFAIVDALSPCPTWNQEQTERYYRDNTLDVPEGHNPLDRTEALQLAFRPDGKFPLGVIFRRDDKPCQTDELQSLRERFAGKGSFDRIIKALAVN